MLEQLPLWLNPGVEPPESLKINGWQPGMKPSAQNMNWLFNRTYEVLKELQEKLQNSEDLSHIQQMVIELEQDLTAHADNNELHLQPGERKKWNDVSTVVSALKMIKSDKDANGTFTTVKTYRKADNTLYQESILSGGTSPNYTTRTVKTYDVDGISVVQQDVYTLTYDEDGTLISEV